MTTSKESTCNASGTSSRRDVIKVLVSELRPYHLQELLTPKAPDNEVDLLAASMALRGLQHPIEILSDGTIICGHMRVEAAKKLDWTHIDAVVLRDLEDKSYLDDSIEIRFIEDNLCRRHLDPLSRARSIQRLFYLKNRSDESEANKAELRLRVGKMLGCSARTVERYLKTLTLPMAIQNAFSQGKLSLRGTQKIACLSEEEQAELVIAIEQGTDPKSALQAKGDQKGIRNVIGELARFLNKMEKAIGGPRIQEIERLGSGTIEALKGGEKLIAAILQRHRDWQQNLTPEQRAEEDNVDGFFAYLKNWKEEQNSAALPAAG